MYSIGVFTNEQSLRRIMQIDGEMRKYGNITYLPYTSPDHLKFLYQQNAGQFDALLFSGSYPYNVIRKHYASVQEIPHAYFNISDRDYYKLIANLAVEHPGMDFSRVYFDRPEIPVDFVSIFRREGVPLLGTAPIDWNRVDAADWYRPLQTYYKDLWDSGTVDLLVTRFGSMEDYFRDNGIRHQYLLPSRESMEETFRGLMMQLSAVAVQDTAACIGLVLSPQTLNKTQWKRLGDKLAACNQQFGMPFLLDEKEGHFQLTTNTSVLKERTQQYTSCPVTAFLEQEVDFPVCVGWGCANSVVEAYHNAQRAVKEAVMSKGTAAFIVLEDNVIVGPLSSARRIVYSDAPSEKLSRLGRQVGISPLYLSKIASVLEQKGSNNLSSEELAFFLNVTTRSASRILSKLESGGLAEVEYNRQLKLRGRPAKIYQIHLGELEG